MPDPATGLRFQVTIDGVELGSFTGCEGLEAQFDIQEYEEGGLNGYVHRIPGRLKYSTVKLTRGLDQDSAKLATWFAAFQREIKRSTASIAAYDANNQTIAQWSLVDVCPVRWSGPSFSSGGNEVVKETLELAHNGFLESA